ncbi:MAG: nickel pincer cofactor biosynthesis protein LarC [Oscillospiraceae bacterium]|nr:nickel pincer cofactor biosynthesis protein LarC [Oscillospiraceae bacterium]
MKTLYLDCSMGASGDMLMASLSQLLDDPSSFAEELNALGIPGVRASLAPASTYGVSGCHMTVTVNGEDEEETHGHEHHHSDLGSVSDIILSLPVSEKVKINALAVYRLIADAESNAHSVPVEQVHFHEVGALDAVADVTGVCMLMEKLGAERIISSPLNLGGGSVRCAHGVLPVPAPAVEFLTASLPCYLSDTAGELLTPTGAALLLRFADSFGDKPEMKNAKTGTGVGSRDFGRPNCLRVWFGETELLSDSVAELSCGMDDMTGEEMGFALERLMEAGALDAYYSPIFMKKNRPAYMLTVLCRPSDQEKLAGLIFRHTTTLGIRKKQCERYILERCFSQKSTDFGPVRVKNGKPEYEDIARLARENGTSLFEIKLSIK